MITTLKRYTPELLGALLCLGLGMLSGLSMPAGDPAWFANLSKPSFNPPDWVFGPVWTVLYIMMGIALGKSWKLRHENEWLVPVFAVQMLFNVAWTPVFFFANHIDWALIDVICLWAGILLYMLVARQHKVLVWLFTPYFLWVSFAAYLNYSLYQLNS